MRKSFARYQGGDNAGHTIVIDGKNSSCTDSFRYLLPLKRFLVIGNGVGINPKSLVKELAYLHEEGVTTDGLLISDRAHVIPPLPYRIGPSPRRVKRGQQNRNDHQRDWTSLHGQGCACGESGSLDLWIAKSSQNACASTWKERTVNLPKLYEAEALSFDDIFEEYYEYGQQIKQYVTDTSVILNDALDNGKRVLFEGAQGVMLDIEPRNLSICTSSNPVAGGTTMGSGVGPSKIDKVVGVCKAYTSRVGDGPFPELSR